jgi:hypothetical protein
MTRSRKVKWAGHIALTGETRYPYKILVGKPEGKRKFGNLGMDRRIMLTNWDDVNRIHLQGRNRW